MNTKNNISVDIPEENLQKAKEGLQLLNEALSPFLIALTPKQRQTLPTMGQNSEAFVSKAMDYSLNSPQFFPAYLEITEMEKDWKTIHDLQPILRELNQLQSNVNDSVLLAGSELYQSSLIFYKSVKSAAKMNVSDAKVIYEDLKIRFERNGKRKYEPE